MHSVAAVCPQAGPLGPRPSERSPAGRNGVDPLIGEGAVGVGQDAVLMVLPSQAEGCVGTTPLGAAHSTILTPFVRGGEDRVGRHHYVDVLATRKWHARRERTLWLRGS